MSSMWLMITEARLQSFGKACDLEAFPCLSLALICSAPSLPCPPTHSCPSPGNLSAVSQVTDSDRSFVCPGLLRPGTIFRWKGKGDGGENTRDSSKAGGLREGVCVCGWTTGGRALGQSAFRNSFLKHTRKCKHVYQPPTSAAQRHCNVKSSWEVKHSRARGGKDKASFCPLAELCAQA